MYSNLAIFVMFNLNRVTIRPYLHCTYYFLNISSNESVVKKKKSAEIVPLLIVIF